MPGVTLISQHDVLRVIVAERISALKGNSMTTADNTYVSMPPRKTLLDWAELARKWRWTLALATGFLMFQADHPAVKDIFRALGGVDDLEERVNARFDSFDRKIDALLIMGTRARTDNARNFTELGQKVQSNTRRIDDLRSDRKIVDWDLNGSYVKPGCRIGGACVAVFRLNRTPFGETCGRPFDLVGTVVNTNGQPHHQRLDDSRAIRATMVKGNVEVDFIAPSLAKPGPARFYVGLTYPGCLPDQPDINLTRSSDEIKFTLLPE